MNRERVLGKRLITAMLVAGLWAAGVQPSSAYVRPGSNSLISVGQDGERGEFDDGKEAISSVASAVSISPSGRHIAFVSGSTLAGNDLNPNPQWQDIYVRDRKRQRTELATGTPSGQPPVFVLQAGASVIRGFMKPSISADGRYVAFISDATNLVDGDTNLLTDVFVSDRKNGAVERVSVGPRGAESDGPSDPSHPLYGGSGVTISADGRYVAFHSQASNLVANDENVGRCAFDDIPPGAGSLPLDSCVGGWDTFVHDRKTGSTELVSVSSQEKQSVGDSGYQPSISADGRYVMFLSNAPDLADLGSIPCPREWSAEVQKRCYHAYVRDRKTGKTELISANTQGEPADMTTFLESEQGLSADGRFALFSSFAQNLVPAGGDPLLGPAIYIRDRRTQRTTRVDVTSTGARIVPDVAACRFPGFSADGRYVAYSCNELLYVHDRHTGETQSSSFGNSGEVVTGNIASVRVSRGGGYLAFASNAPGWVQGNDQTLGTGDVVQRDFDVYVRDRGDALRAGLGGRGSGDDGGVDGDGICIDTNCIDPINPVSYRDPAGDVPPGTGRMGADLRAASFASRPYLGDLFVRIEFEHLSVPSGRAATNRAIPLYGLSFQADGVPFEVRAQLTSGAASPSGRKAIFTLFRCESPSTCSRPVHELEGGYGTTGEEIVTSIPLQSIGLGVGGTLTEVEAFSGAGTRQGGTATLWDRIGVSHVRARGFLL